MSPSAREVFPRNLQKLMDAKGIKQKDLALALGVTPTAINDWVKGKKYPRVDKIESITRLFGITQAELIEEHKPVELLTPKQIGEKIKSRLAERGMTSEELDEKAEVKKGTTAKWIAGKLPNPTLGMIKIASEYLGMTSAELHGIQQSKEITQKQKLFNR